MKKTTFTMHMLEIIDAAKAALRSVDDGDEDECYHQIEVIEENMKSFADFDFPTDK